MAAHRIALSRRITTRAAAAPAGKEMEMFTSGVYGVLGVICGGLSLFFCAVSPNNVSPELAGAISLAVLASGFFVGAAVMKGRSGS